ncbi:hypothetical protein PACTADRAFT_51772, partial [Pachysolen tannophilus NRRL Y-2460]
MSGVELSANETYSMYNTIGDSVGTSIVNNLISNSSESQLARNQINSPPYSRHSSNESSYAGSTSNIVSSSISSQSLDNIRIQSNSVIPKLNTPPPHPYVANSTNKMEHHTNNLNNYYYPQEYQYIQPTFFTEEDILVMKKLLPLAELHKFKYISNKVSKARSKKISLEFTREKFHQFFDLPLDPKIAEHHNLDVSGGKNGSYDEKNKNKNNVNYSKSHKNIEGLLGSSIPYLV